MTRYLLFLFVSSSLLLWASCKKQAEPGSTDEMLYNMAIARDNATWYKFDDAFLDKSAGSGHNYPFLRTWYNPTAAQHLDSTGKVAANASFADGSLIVKELYSQAKEMERFAILYKDSDNADADDRGWVWGYVNGNGSVATSAADKGAICTGCHSQADNVDYMLMNKYFP